MRRIFEPYAAGLAKRGSQRSLDLRYLNRPIPDLGIVRDEVYDEIVKTVRSGVEGGRPTYVHCWDGVGRTGTVVGCWLAGGGLSVDEVAKTLVRLRSGSCKADRQCPETRAQRDVIRRRCRAS